MTNQYDGGDIMPASNKKTLIGVLAPHDDRVTNQTLVSIFTNFFNHGSKEALEGFHFVFTGGTHDRIFFGDSGLGVSPLARDVATWIRHQCGVTRLQRLGQVDSAEVEDLLSHFYLGTQFFGTFSNIEDGGSSLLLDSNGRLLLPRHASVVGVTKGLGKLMSTTRMD